MQKIKNTAAFGNNLRILRKSYQLSQEQVTARLNLLGIDISRSKYSRYETGELNIPIQIIIGLHIIYQCPYDAFFQNLTI